MEAEEINNHHGGSKRPRSGKIGRRDLHDMDDGAAAAAAEALHPWQQQHHPASRIFRVSRASGGKDRHSKVYTSKGLRDRRVRLSVSTAIQFYDLQDRLGYDQPSKAIEWLIKAADGAITELPTLESPFATELDAKPELGGGDEDVMQQQQQQQQLSKSGCSSTSETSKGSVLSLSRSETHVKARDGAPAANHQIIINSQGSFTELLTGNSSNGAVAAAAAAANAAQMKSFRYMPVISTANYLAPAATNQSLSSGYLGNGSPIGMVPFNVAPEMQQHFSFSQDHAAIPIAAVGSQGDYNLSFSFSPGLAGFNRGTLQSNPPSQQLPYHHLPRLPSPAADNRSSIPFFFSSAAATPSSENQFPAGLQLCYDDGYRHSELKGKDKN